MLNSVYPSPGPLQFESTKPSMLQAILLINQSATITIIELIRNHVCAVEVRWRVARTGSMKKVTAQLGFLN